MGAMMVPAATRMPRLAAMVRAEEMEETMGGSMVVTLCWAHYRKGRTLGVACCFSLQDQPVPRKKRPLWGARLNADYYYAAVTHTLAIPCDGLAMRAKAPSERSMMRPGTCGPLSLILIVT